MEVVTELETPLACFYTEYTESDRQVWEEDLASFVPMKIFDAHIHLWSDILLPPDDPNRGSSPTWDMPTTVEVNQTIFPGREIGYLILGNPFPGCDVDAQSRFFAEQMKLNKNSRVHRLVTPACRVEDIRADIETLGFTGLKPYRIFSTTGDIDQCRIHEFLTHEQMELANDLGLWVTMHLSRQHGCADEYNLKDLEEYTNNRYPKIKWILAHCARAFTYWPLRQSIDRLRDMPNIWYDSSAVTDFMPHYTLFKKEDHRRIMFGTDNLVANAWHGKYVAMGRFWYQMGTPQPTPDHTDARPVLSVYEQLLCMKHAAEIAELSPSQIEDIFFNNAQAALGLED